MTFNELVEKVKEFEGFRGTAYQCPAGVWTIGYGTTRGVKQGDTITEEKATELLVATLTTIRSYVVTNMDKHGYNCTENQILALTSFCHNGGNGWLSQVTNNYIRDLDTVAEKMLLYCNATVNGVKTKLAGLVKRRQWEHDLFVTPDTPTATDTAISNMWKGNICFKVNDEWLPYENTHAKNDENVDCVALVNSNGESILIPETMIESMEIPITFIGV